MRSRFIDWRMSFSENRSPLFRDMRWPGAIFLPSRCKLGLRLHNLPIFVLTKSIPANIRRQDATLTFHKMITYYYLGRSKLKLDQQFVRTLGDARRW
jgi:hypothetical protein